MKAPIKGRGYKLRGGYKPWKRLVHPFYPESGHQVYFISSRNGTDWGTAVQSQPFDWWNARVENPEGVELDKKGNVPATATV